jgi:chemotaxis signal transduction protein
VSALDATADAVLDADTAQRPAAEAPEPAAVERAQAVRCGERWVAFPYGWSRAAVEQVHLTAVPGAPPWLAGAANVEGRIVPVIDLLAWASPGRFVDAGAKDARLLVGGDAEQTVAVLFQGLPRLVGVTRQPQAIGNDRLTPYLLGHAQDDVQTVALDAPRWVGALIEELALR